MILQGCVIPCGTVVFFQKSRNLSRSLLTSNNFYSETTKVVTSSTRLELFFQEVTFSKPFKKLFNAK